MSSPPDRTALCLWAAGGRAQSRRNSSSRRQPWHSCRQSIHAGLCRSSWRSQSPPPAAKAGLKVNDIIIKELNSPRSKFLNLTNNNSKRSVRLGYKHYKLASIVKSRSDIINALDLDDYQGLLFIIYTATVKGIYSLDLSRDLIGQKISAGYVVKNGKKVLDL